MEAGKVGDRALDLVDAMVMAADDSVSDEEVDAVEKNACPTCGSCSGMFTVITSYSIHYTKLYEHLNPKHRLLIESVHFFHGKKFRNNFV